ncbi:MAG TPA: hypothetical protein VMU50_05700 [Polyangia bacterium]|nr:hypothetical protein [Polyangia bacterium]
MSTFGWAVGAMLGALIFAGCGGSSSSGNQGSGGKGDAGLDGVAGGSGGLSGGAGGTGGGTGGQIIDAPADVGDGPAADVPADTGGDATVDTTGDGTGDGANDGAADSAGDLAPCGADGSTCTLTTGGNGLCVSNSCTPCVDTTDDNRCSATYGAMHICVGGACVAGGCHASTTCNAGKVCSTTAHTCGDCAGDPSCKNDTVYGAATICLGGSCVTGDCHDTSADCPSGKLCGVTTTHHCDACTTDAQCTGDTAYGANHLCVGGGCVAGNCHDSSTCNGMVCGATAANTCGACTSDNQCQTDAKYGAAFICDTTVGQANSGKCVAATCTTASAACAANAADICCGGTCTAGNCCTDDVCRTMFGQGFACSANHTCSQCAAALANQYVVDPVGGNDATATGSGKVGTTTLASCAFKTITRALQVIGASPPAGTTITILGTAGGTTKLYTVQAAGQSAPETLPIRLPTNVKITTAGGPVQVVLPAMASAFLLTAAGASIAGDPAAQLTIDGANQTSGSAIVVQTGAGNTAALSGVKVQNTGDDGILVSSGTLNIGAGVVVTGAGTTAAAGTRHDGLHITGGIVNITVNTGQTQTSFSNNSSRGIEVGGVGILNITGVPVTTAPITGDGTVVARFNDLANIYINQTPGAAAAVSVIDGVVAWASNNGQGGIHIVGGSKVKLRHSVSLANALAGVAINDGGNNAAGNNLAGIDLGTANDFGHNILQASIGSNPNLGAGVCVRPGANAGAQTLTAMGNVFSGPRDCSQTAPGAVARSANCAGRVDVSIVPAGNAVITLPLNNCQ